MRIISLVIPLSLTLAACGNKVGNSGNIGTDSGVVIDLDEDGSPAGEDCDDGDPNTHPGAEELCDGIDNDCNGVVDDGAVGATTWYTDADGDTYGDPGSPVTACEQPEGAVADNSDCNDGDTAFHPGADETNCTDPNDYNCDGSVGYADADADGVPACLDCDDANPLALPGGTEVCDGVDNDCDSLVDDADDTLDLSTAGTWYTDTDTDSFGNAAAPVRACVQPAGTVADATDCDDTVTAINPAATEICNGLDDDCDTLADSDDPSFDETTLGTWYLDTDHDGYGQTDVSTASCTRPDGYVAASGDCNDDDHDVNPGATEVCDDLNVDENCNGLADDADSGATGKTTWHIDYDGDTYGSTDFTIVSCDQPARYVASGDDCDDANSAINPAATEICNGLDDDCDTLIDDADDSVTGTSTWYVDTDHDTYGTTASATNSCIAPTDGVSADGDCDDGNSAVNSSAAEVCNGIDDDCDTLVDDEDSSVTGTSTWYIDADHDGYGVTASASDACTAPTDGVSASGDCNDDADTVHPDADEYCNGVDDNCNGTVDESAVDGAWSATDADHDGFGAPGTSVWTCDAVVDNELDCDDRDPGEPVAVSATAGSASGDGSITSPFASIQDGIDASYQCVVVDSGTYAEAIDFGGKDVTVTSMNGPRETTIDATGLGVPAVSFTSYETDAAVLDGFTISGGDGNQESTTDSVACTSVTTCTTYTTTWCGGGIYTDGAGPTLQNLVLVSNVLPDYSETTSGDDTYLVYSYGGGLCALGSSTVSLDGVTFQENHADQGGAVYVDETSSVQLSRTWLIANTATDGAGIQIDGGEAQLDNVASMWNTATDDAGGVLGIDGSLTMTNVTLAGDDGTLSGAVYASGATTVGLYNAIVSADSAAATVTGDGSASITVTYSDVYNAGAGSAWSGFPDPTGTTGNISVDPYYTAWSDDGDWTNDDITLNAALSTCDNRGNPDTAYNDADGSRNDMGAFGGPNGGSF